MRSHESPERDPCHLDRHHEFPHRSPIHGLPCRTGQTSNASGRSVGGPQVWNSTAVAQNVRIRTERRARSGAPRIACWRCDRIGQTRSIDWARHKTPGGSGDSRLAHLPSRLGSPVIRVDLLSEKSRKKPVGPEKNRRWSDPASPGPGWKNTWPVNGSAPSGETPLLSRGLIAPSAMMNGPSSVIRNRTMFSSSCFVYSVLAVF